MPIYHLKGGASFEQMPGGRVQVNLSDDQGRTVVATAEAEEWAGVIAAMSYGGETDEQVAAALELHVPAAELQAVREHEQLAAKKAEEDAVDAEAKAVAAVARAADVRSAAVKIQRRIQGGQKPSG